MVEIAGYFVAAGPFVVAGVALLLLGWSAGRAGTAALGVAVLGAFVWPGLGASGLGEAFLEGLGTSGRVLYVLFGGLLLYNLLSSGGAIEAVAEFLGRLEPEKEALALLVVIGAAPFFESVTGFGVAVVISAPVLLAAGFSPIKAAVLASWGQSAVPWGALGVGTLIGADLSGISFGELSDWSAVLSLPLFPIYAVAAVALAGGWEGLRRYSAEAFLLGLVMSSATLLTSLYFLPELSGALGGLAASGAFIALRWRRLRVINAPIRAMLPYAFLLALLAVTNGTEPIKAWLQSLGPVFEGPGLSLLLSAVFAALMLGVKIQSSSQVIRGTFGQWLPVAGAVLMFVLAGQVVAASGAAATLASAAVGFGSFYPMVSPILGALGGALTGSNAASNALFMPLQVEAARGLGSSEALIAGIQNVAGSNASLISPQRMILAASIVGLAGREGAVARCALSPVLLSIAVLGIIGMLLTAL